MTSRTRHPWLTAKAVAAAKPQAKEYAPWARPLAHFGVRESCGRTAMSRAGRVGESAEAGARATVRSDDNCTGRVRRTAASEEWSGYRTVDS